MNLSHDQLEKWANAAVLVYTPPPIAPPGVHVFRLIVPCAPLTARNPSAPLASGVVFQMGDVVNVGVDGSLDGWLWVSDTIQSAPGIGFIPSSYARPL